ESGAIPNDAYQVTDTTTWIGSKANIRILMILKQEPAEAIAIAAFVRLAQTLVAWWDLDNKPQRRRNRPEHDYEVEGVLGMHLQEFVIRTSTAAAGAILQPLLDAVDRQPKK